jgi:hypothetical protein
MEEEIDLIAEQIAIADIMANHEFVLYEKLVIIKDYENKIKNN